MNALWRAVLQALTATRSPARSRWRRVAFVACAAVLVGASLGPGLSLARARLVASGPLVTGLTVNDSANASSWSVQSNLQTGDTAYGDRTYTWTSVPSGLLGDAWVRTAAASKTVTTNPLASFTLSQPATVSVGVDTRLGRLSWVDSSWVDTGAQMVDNDASTAHFELFQKSFGAGSVSLGPNAGSGSSYLMYVVVLTPTGGGPTPTPSSSPSGGPAIGGLTVNDTANAGSWSVQSNLQVGDTAYGDRTYTWTSVPSALLGDPWIRTAAASKTVTTNPLATFTLGGAGVVSVGVDTRLGRLSWIDSSWVDTGTQLVSNDSSTAHFEVFQKSFGAGTVTLGPNAGSGSTYLMYVVAVTPSAGGPTPTPTPTGTPTPTPSGSPTPTPTPTPTPSSGCLHNGPVPGKPPGCNFDLSVWSLQLPIGSPGSPTTIPNSQLEAGFTDQFFFTGSDGAMDFVDPGVNCVTTPNSTHCRTELREVNTNGSDAAWPASGTNTLSATLVVTDARGAPVVGQIHLDPAISVRPLVELFYTTSGDLVAGVEQCNAGGCETRTTVGHAAPGTKFTYVINYSQSKLSITVNGVTTQLSSPILGEGGYFKAGDYGQSPTNAAVNFYALKIVHA